MTKLIIIGALLVSASIASAQPSLTEPTPPPFEPTAPTTYLEGGAALGIDSTFYDGVTLEGGRRLDNGPWWIHGELVGGNAFGIDEATYSGHYHAARVGLEAHGALPLTHGIVAVVGGVDAGLRHVDLMAEYDKYNRVGGAVYGRFGLDIGGEHLRFRPGLEVSLDAKGWSGVGFAAGIGYQW